MRHQLVITANEHSPINLKDGFSVSEDNLKAFDKDFEDQKSSLKYLGIHREKKDILESYLNYEKKETETDDDKICDISKVKAHYIIGYRWWEEGISYIYVSAKEHDNKKADYMKMFMECLKDPIVAKKLDKTYKIFFDEPLIEIDNHKGDITPLLIIHFLHMVKNISRKGLKKGYITVTENLTSKIKGKILINQTIKKNHLKNRLDKTVCNHQIFTINCLENKILKTALMQCGKHLQGISDPDVIKMLRQNINTFELVEEMEVFDSDFSKIKHSPFYKEYKEALNLAKMIFKRFGFIVNNKTDDMYKTKIPPYYINMPELFERYVELKLLEKYPTIVDGNRNRVAVWGMKPDFLLPDQHMIIDAKYKYWFEDGKNGNNSENSEYKADYMQLSLYGRDSKVRENIGLNGSNDEAQLLFIYPTFDEKERTRLISLDGSGDEVDTIESHKFNNIKRMPLFIPFIKTGDIHE